MACGLDPTEVHRLWHMDFIPYVADDLIYDVVNEAIEHIQAMTPLRFAWRSFDSDYMYISASAGANGSGLGRFEGRNDIVLADGVSMGVAVHEICHSLGLWHEHAHPNRDYYLDIHWNNIVAGKRPQFLKDSSVVALTDYDSASIMHYQADLFSDPAGSLVLINKNGDPIGQREGLSAGDIEGLYALHPHLAW